MIKIYENKPAQPYDFTRDVLGQTFDLDAVMEAVEKSGVTATAPSYPNRLHVPQPNATASFHASGH